MISSRWRRRVCGTAIRAGSSPRQNRPAEQMVARDPPLSLSLSLSLSKRSRRTPLLLPLSPLERPDSATGWGRDEGRGGGGGGGGWREITQMRNDHQAIGRTSVSAGSRRFATSATEDIHVRTTIAGVDRCSFFNAETHGEAHLKRTQCLGIFLGRWKKGWSE